MSLERCAHCGSISVPRGKIRDITREDIESGRVLIMGNAVSYGPCQEKKCGKRTWCIVTVPDELAYLAQLVPAWPRS